MASQPSAEHIAEPPPPPPDHRLHHHHHHHHHHQDVPDVTLPPSLDTAPSAVPPVPGIDCIVVDQAPPPPQEEQYDEDDLLFEEMVDDDGSCAPVCSIQAIAGVFERGNAQEVITMLPELVTLSSACPDGLQACIIPMLCIKLPRWGPDLQLATGEHILQCAFASNDGLAKAIALCAIQVGVSSLSSDNLTSTTLMPQLLATYGDILLHALSATMWSHTYCIKILALVDHFATSATATSASGMHHHHHHHHHHPDVVVQQTPYQSGHKLLAVKILRGLCASKKIPPPLLTSALLPRLWTLLLSDRGSKRANKQHSAHNQQDDHASLSHQSIQSLQQRFAMFGSNVLGTSFQLSHSAASVASSSLSSSSSARTSTTAMTATTSVATGGVGAGTAQVNGLPSPIGIGTTAGMEDTDEEILVKAHLVCALCGLSEHFSSRKLLDKLWPAILSVWNDDKDGYGRAIILPCVACMLNTSSESAEKTSQLQQEAVKSNSRQNSNNKANITKNNNNINDNSSRTSSIAHILVGSNNGGYSKSLSSDSGLVGFVQSICSWTLSITSTSSSLTSSAMTGGRRLQPIALLPEGIYACLTMVANHLPILLNVLSRTCAAHWLRDALKAYCSLASCDDVTLREACAYGLATMCAACTSRHAMEKLSRVCAALTKDSESRVRIAIASTLSKLPTTVANGNMLSTLLGDSDRRVTTALLPTLAACLKTFLPCGSNMMPSASTQSLGKNSGLGVGVAGVGSGGAAAVGGGPGGASGNGNNNNGNNNTSIIDIRVGACLMDFVCTPAWRTRQLLADQLGDAAKVFANGSTRSRDEILLLLRTFFRDCIGEVRQSAGVSILKIIRLIRTASVRHRELRLFFSEYGQIDGSCSIRLSLVDILYEAAHLFSNQSFRAHGFAARLLLLGMDDISNVRLKVAKRLHTVVLACDDPLTVDNPMLPDVVNALANDDDDDVRASMIQFDARSAKIASSRRAARKDLKKFTFERWLYMDQFTNVVRRTRHHSHMHQRQHLQEQRHEQQQQQQQQHQLQQSGQEELFADTTSKHDREFHSQPFMSTSAARAHKKLMHRTGRNSNKLSRGHISLSSSSSSTASSMRRRMIAERRGGNFTDNDDNDDDDGFDDGFDGFDDDNDDDDENRGGGGSGNGSGDKAAGYDDEDDDKSGVLKRTEKMKLPDSAPTNTAGRSLGGGKGRNKPRSKSHLFAYTLRNHHHNFMHRAGNTTGRHVDVDGGAAKATGAGGVGDTQGDFRTRQQAIQTEDAAAATAGLVGTPPLIRRRKHTRVSGGSGAGDSADAQDADFARWHGLSMAVRRMKQMFSSRSSSTVASATSASPSAAASTTSASASRRSGTSSSLLCLVGGYDDEKNKKKNNSSSNNNNLNGSDVDVDIMPDEVDGGVVAGDTGEKGYQQQEEHHQHVDRRQYRRRSVRLRRQSWGHELHKQQQQQQQQHQDHAAQQHGPRGRGNDTTGGDGGIVVDEWKQLRCRREGLYLVDEDEDDDNGDGDDDKLSEMDDGELSINEPMSLPTDFGGGVSDMDVDLSADLSDFNVRGFARARSGLMRGLGWRENEQDEGDVDENRDGNGNGNWSGEGEKKKIEGHHGEDGNVEEEEAGGGGGVIGNVDEKEKIGSTTVLAQCVG